MEEYKRKGDYKELVYIIGKRIVIHWKTEEVKPSHFFIGIIVFLDSFNLICRYYTEGYFYVVKTNFIELYLEPKGFWKKENNQNICLFFQKLRHFSL